jgi:hypothetical protein
MPATAVSDQVLCQLAFGDEIDERRESLQFLRSARRVAIAANATLRCSDDDGSVVGDEVQGPNAQIELRDHAESGTVTLGRPSLIVVAAGYFGGASSVSGVLCGAVGGYLVSTSRHKPN